MMYPVINLGPADWIVATDMDTGEEFWYPKDPQHDIIHRRILRDFGPPEPGYRYSYNENGVVIYFPVSDRAYDFIPPPPGFTDVHRIRKDTQRRVSRAHGSRHETHESGSKQHARRKSSYARDNGGERDNERENRERRRSTFRRPSTAKPRERDEVGSHDYSRREQNYVGEEDRYREPRRRRPSYRHDARRRDNEPLLPDEIESPSSSDTEGDVETRPKLLEWDIDRLSERIERL